MKSLQQCSKEAVIFVCEAVKSKCATTESRKNACVATIDIKRHLCKSRDIVRNCGIVSNSLSCPQSQVGIMLIMFWHTEERERKRRWL